MSGKNPEFQKNIARAFKIMNGGQLAHVRDAQKLAEGIENRFVSQLSQPAIQETQRRLLKKVR